MMLLRYFLALLLILTLPALSLAASGVIEACQMDAETMAAADDDHGTGGHGAHAVSPNVAEAMSVDVCPDTAPCVMGAAFFPPSAMANPLPPLARGIAIAHPDAWTARSPDSAWRPPRFV